MRFADEAEFITYVLAHFPNAVIHEDVDGEMAIYPGLSNDGPNGIVPTEET